MSASIKGGVGCRCSRTSLLLLFVSLALLTLLVLLSSLAVLCRQQQQQQPLLRRNVESGSHSLKRRLPQAILIGARKCGTRALLNFLSIHPQVVAAKGEVHYFDDPERLQLGLDWYRQRMPLSHEDQVTMEKSPAYFVTEEAPSLMRSMNSSLRIVLILRDPITRIVSDYTQLQKRRLKLHRRTKTLEQTVLNRRGQINTRAKVVKVSMYQKHLKRWLRHFPASQIHLVDGDLMAVRPHEELQRVEAFLGLSPYIGQQHFVFNATKGFYCVRKSEDANQRCLGSGKGRRHPSVSPQTLKKLRRFFRPQDDRLVQLVGRRFRWMRSDKDEEEEEEEKEEPTSSFI